MITKAQVKHIQSLDDKKYRQESNSYLVEGDKMVLEVLNSVRSLKEVYAVKEWLNRNMAQIPNHIPVYELSQQELERVSHLKSPNSVLAVLELPVIKDKLTCGRLILLDTIQDPGNMGSIIRIADWFGLDGILLYGQCVDPYSPKCVQSTMGSILRTRISTVSLQELDEHYGQCQIIGATLQGKSLKEANLWQTGILAIGNESKGLSNEIQMRCSQQVRIEGMGNAESLNAAVATGIICHALLC